MRCTSITHFIVAMMLMASFSGQANDLKTLRKTCSLSPKQCLIQADPQLEKTKKHSRLWFELTMLKMEALFNLQQIDALYQEAAPWVEADNIPVFFQIRTWIYYAKVETFRDKALANKYLTKAKTALQSLSPEQINPLRLVEIANLELYLQQDLNAAYQDLLTLAKKFNHREEAFFKAELYGNLGHLAVKLKRFEEQLSHTSEALKWAIEVGNQQQISVAYSNQGSAFKSLNNLSQAEQSYLKASEYAALANDIVISLSVSLNLTEIYWQQDKKKLAKRTFSQIAATHPPKHIEPKYLRIQKLVSQ